MRRRKIVNRKLNNTVKLVCTIVSISFIVTQIIYAVHLSQSPSRKSPKVGEFGETVIRMLPEDLAFTVFLPSEEAIRRDLRLKRNDSDSYSVLTRVLGFSTVARRISSADLERGKQRWYDSISGLSLLVGKDWNGDVVVNGVVSEAVDLRIGEIVVHLMDGVVMDSELEQWVKPDDDEDESN